MLPSLSPSLDILSNEEWPLGISLHKEPYDLMKAVVNCSILYKEYIALLGITDSVELATTWNCKPFWFVLILFWGRSNARSMYWSFQISCFNLSPIKAEMGVDIAPVFVVFSQL
jgi:hypothetical protein